MLNDPILIGGAVVGLAMGSFGYVLFRFAWRPAHRYRSLKRQIRALVGPGRPDALKSSDRDRLRQLAVEMHALASEELPHWYRLKLEKQGESPEEAVRQIQSLVNCRDHKALKNRRAGVGQALGFGAEIQ